MTAEINFRDDILEVTVPEVWPRSEALRVQAEAARLLETLGCRRILVDCRRLRATRLKTADTFELTAAHATAFPPGTRHAVVVAAADRNATVVEFAEVVAGNRGIVMRTFDDLEPARRWLRDPRDPERRPGASGEEAGGVE